MICSRVTDTNKKPTPLKKQFKGRSEIAVDSPYFPQIASVPASNLLRKVTKSLRKSVSDEIKKGGRTKEAIKKSIHTLPNNDQKNSHPHTAGCNKIDTNLIKMIGKQHSQIEKIKKNFIKMNKSYCKTLSLTDKPSEIPKNRARGAKIKTPNPQNIVEKKKRKKRKFPKKSKSPSKHLKKSTQNSVTYISKIGNSEDDFLSRPSNQDNVSTQIEKEKRGDSDESYEQTSFRLGKCIIKYQDKAFVPTSTEEISQTGSTLIVNKAGSYENFGRGNEIEQYESRTSRTREGRTHIKGRGNSYPRLSRSKSHLNNYKDDWDSDNPAHYSERRCNHLYGFGDGHDSKESTSNLKISVNKKGVTNKYPYEFYRDVSPTRQPHPKHMTHVDAISPSKEYVRRWQNDSANWLKNKPEYRSSQTNTSPKLSQSSIQAQHRWHGDQYTCENYLHRQSRLPVKKWGFYDRPSNAYAMGRCVKTIPSLQLDKWGFSNNHLHPNDVGYLKSNNYPQQQRASFKNQLFYYKKLHVRDLPKIDESTRESLNNSGRITPNFSVTTLNDIKNYIPSDKRESQGILDRIRKAVHDQVHKQHFLNEVQTPPRPSVIKRRPFRFT